MSKSITSTSPCESEEYHSVSVRKIDNGYLLSRSSSGPKGYKTKELYYSEKPVIDVDKIVEEKQKEMTAVAKASRPRVRNV